MGKKANSFNFRKIGGRVYRSWKLWEEGDEIIAKYIQPYEDQFGNTCHEVEIIESDFHDKDLEEGVILGLNSCGGLNHKLEDVVKGTTVRVEYEGEDVIEKGKMKGKMFHKVAVSIDDSTADHSAAVKQKPVEEEDDDL